MLQQANIRLPRQFPPYVLEHLKTRVCSVLDRKQKVEYYKPENYTKLKNKIRFLAQGKAFTWYPQLALSMLTRVAAYEACFGDYSGGDEQPNLAYQICQSILKVSSILCKIATEVYQSIISLANNLSCFCTVGRFLKQITGVLEHRASRRQLYGPRLQKKTPPRS